MKPLPRWYLPALGLVLALAALLGFWKLGSAGYPNPSYATTVLSMLQQARAFWYAGFDPGGFLSIDKPPVGFWFQALSAALFGFRPWSLLLPQVLAHILSVALLAEFVRRSFEPRSALIAALLLTLTPISVATSRNNTIDSLLIPPLLGACWLAWRASVSGSTRLLLLSMMLLGLGVNIKMLQALIPLPACGLTYLCFAPYPLPRRLRDLALAGMVLLGLSLVWPLSVDFTPATQRPYVDGSCHNSALELMLRYNGLFRLFGARWSCEPGSTRSLVQRNAEIGAPGPLRLLARHSGPQIGWFLLPALLGASVALRHSRVSRQPARQPAGAPATSRLRSQHVASWLWTIWLLSGLLLFSAMREYHLYYLIMLAPAIATLAAILASHLIERERGATGLLLVSAAVQFYLAWQQRDWLAWLPGLIAAGALLTWFDGASVWRRSLRGVALATFLIAPLIWSASPALLASNPLLPHAGPVQEQRGRNSELGELLAIIAAHPKPSRFLLATLDTHIAAPIILATGKPVLALGGFSGDAPTLTPAQLRGLIEAGEFRFAMLPFAEQRYRRWGAWLAAECMVASEQAWYFNGDPYRLLDCARE